MTLVDSHGRRFEYLRLSVDDACNFRCLYCLPDGFKKAEPEAPLSVDEIRRLTAAFAGMGFWKVRLTGGEPTTRQDIVALAEAVGGTPGVTKVALSTNGYRLLELAAPLTRAGVSAVNVSVDSLIPERFLAITGHSRLADVLRAVDRCVDIGLETKVNAVLLKGRNDDELEAFLEYVKPRSLSLRFIELMPTADNADLFSKSHLSADAMIPLLQKRGWSELERQPGAGPARAFRHPDYKGTVGFIAPYARGFCGNCNRLRVTSRGRLRLCLFAEGEFSLRPWLQRDDQIGELQNVVSDLVLRKDASHFLHDGKLGDTKHFAAMGG